MALAVEDLMETDVVTVEPELTLSELEDVLLQSRVHGAPVLEEGRIVGIISRSDIVRQMKLEEQRIADSAFYLEPYDADDLAEADHARVLEAAGRRLMTLRVRDMMILDVVTVAPDASIQELALCMLTRGIHRVLVTEGEKLVGIVSSQDMVELIASGRLQEVEDEA